MTSRASKKVAHRIIFDVLQQSKGNIVLLLPTKQRDAVRVWKAIEEIIGYHKHCSPEEDTQPEEGDSPEAEPDGDEPSLEKFWTNENGF